MEFTDEMNPIEIPWISPMEQVSSVIEAHASFLRRSSAFLESSIVQCFHNYSFDDSSPSVYRYYAAGVFHGSS